MYKQSIFLFGIILPLLAALGFIALGNYAKSEVESSFADKKQHFAGSEMTRKTAQELEKQMNQKRGDLERWQNEVSKESASEVTRLVRNISANLPAKELQQTASDRPPGKTGFGQVSAQDSTQLRMAFRGTYRTMERAFLELESRMPQLQMQELKIDPTQNRSSLLNFQVVFTAWEN